MEFKYLLYFLNGGIIVSLVTYFACNSRGILAAFIANLPLMTVMTFLTINSQSGKTAVVSYAHGLIMMLFPWLAYITAIILLTPRLGLMPSLVTGIALYLLIAFVIINFKGF